MPSSSRPRRYLALIFPWLPVERLRAARPHLFVGRHNAPIALTESVGNTLRLVAVDLAAARMGLKPGETLADARAIVPDLETFQHDPGADCDWLERLADGCLRYTPMVAVRPPDGLVMDIAGCTHAFEGERPLAADLEARMRRRGILIRHAFGGTPEAALALARYAGAPAPDETGALKRLPVAALGLDEEASVALARAGLKTVGDVMKRPLASLAARFGESAADAVRRLSGEVRTPIRSRQPRTPIWSERRFADPIARTDDVLDVLGELVGEVAARMEVLHQGGRRWLVRLYRSDGHVRPLQVETGQPTRDAAVLGRLFRERIDSLADPLDPGFGYDMVRLDVALAERLEGTQLKLEGGGDARSDVDDLIDRLTTRLGKDRVRRFAPRDSHIPEQAELMLPATDPRPAGAWPQPEAGEPPLRPIYLFDPPRPIETLAAEFPDGPPHRFRWRKTLYEVARAEGPERIEGEWWRQSDREAPARDYYRVEDRRGRRFWIFRHGRYAESERPRWYIHGLFA